MSVIHMAQRTFKDIAQSIAIEEFGPNTIAREGGKIFYLLPFFIDGGNEIHSGLWSARDGKIVVRVAKTYEDTIAELVTGRDLVAS